MLIPKDKLAELTARLKADNPELHLIAAAGEQLIARPPTRAEYMRFVDDAAETKRRARSLETLARSCILHPDPEALDALLEKKPGIAAVVSEKLLEIAGVDDEVEAKKL